MIKNMIALSLLAFGAYAQNGIVQLQGGSRLGYPVQNLSQHLLPADAGKTAIELTIDTRFHNAIFTEVTGPGYYDTLYVPGCQWDLGLGSAAPSPITSFSGFGPDVYLSYWETDAFDGIVDWRGPTVHWGSSWYQTPIQTIVIQLADIQASGQDLWFSASMSYGSITSHGMANYSMPHYLRNHFYSTITYRYL